MAHIVDNVVGTPAAVLRTLLDEAERALVQLDHASVEGFLLGLDAIERQVALIGESVEVRAEVTRWQSLQQRVQRRPELISRAAGRGGLEALRQAHPPAAGFWWHTDAAEWQRRRAWLRSAAIVVVLLVVGGFAVQQIYQLCCAPSPEVVARYSAQLNVRDLTGQGEYVKALETVEAALVQFPADGELLLWGYVLANQLGDQAAVLSYGDRAMDAYGGATAEYWQTLAELALSLGNADLATAAATGLLAENPDAPFGHYALGGAAELRGDRVTALEGYEKAAALAETTQPELVVLARVRIAQLLNTIDMPVTPSPEAP
jgi:tetratricopeptide (TPR) repeat protein